MAIATVFIVVGSFEVKPHLEHRATEHRATELRATERRATEHRAKSQAELGVMGGWWLVISERTVDARPLFSAQGSFPQSLFVGTNL